MVPVVARSQQHRKKFFTFGIFTSRIIGWRTAMVDRKRHNPVTNPAHLAAAVFQRLQLPLRFPFIRREWTTTLHFARARVRRVHLLAPQNSHRQIRPVAHPAAVAPGGKTLDRMIIAMCLILSRIDWTDHRAAGFRTHLAIDRISLRRD